MGGNCLDFLQNKSDFEVVGTHRSYATDRTVFYSSLEPDSSINFNILEFSPDVIIHCGALTHVDYCETNPEESFEKTVTSTKNLLKLNHSIGAKFVYISTDYVFNGERGPYVESDDVDPLNIYGKHKLEAENLVKERENHLILRVTNVYGDEDRNKNFVSRILEQVKRKERISLKLPFDQFGTPINAMDIARVIYLLIGDDKRGLYHIGGSDFMNRTAFSQRIFMHFPDAEYDVTNISTADFNQPAKRLLLGGLNSAKFLGEYPDFVFTNLDDYLVSRK